MICHSGKDNIEETIEDDDNLGNYSMKAESQT
jgi:hypothetical protein